MIIAVAAILGLVASFLRTDNARTVEASALLALAQPTETVAGERYVGYAGMDIRYSSSYVVRLCNVSGSCPVNRSAHVSEMTAGWGWIMAVPPQLPPGQYFGELMMRREDAFGVERTAERFTWIQRVQ